MNLPESHRERYHLVEQRVDVGAARFTIVRPRDAEALISEEDFARDERLPYWAELWPSALALGAHLLGESGVGRRAIELGCGVGLVACCAARAGFAVTATDYYADALVFCESNARANDCRLDATRLVDWKELPDDLGQFDVVMAADVLYERPYGALVAQAIHRLLAPGGTAWVADPGRVWCELFLAESATLGLAPRALTRHAVTAFGRTHDIALFELTGSRHPG